LVRFNYGINAAAFLPSISYSAEIFDGCPLLPIATMLLTGIVVREER
jgi:hypothetical protein